MPLSSFFLLNFGTDVQEKNPPTCHKSLAYIVSVISNILVFFHFIISTLNITSYFHRLPENSRILPTIGNGHVATVVYTDTIYMNGLYNGLKTLSHRARIPSTCAIEITSTSAHITKSLYSLDVETGMS